MADRGGAQIYDQTGNDFKSDWTNSSPTKAGSEEGGVDAGKAGAEAAGAGGFPGGADAAGTGANVGATIAMGAAASAIKDEVSKADFNHEEGANSSYTEQPAFGGSGGDSSSGGNSGSSGDSGDLGDSGDSGE